MNIRDTYDELPYESIAFSSTHPDYLYSIGRLFGMRPASPTQCRVLEIGSASGGNLIPMAFYNPECEFVGIELSEVQTQQAQATIKKLGLRNIRIEAQNVMQLEKQFGEFDYIIAHGIYSWVPPQVQEKILKVCRDLLSPQGLAYISYNVKPGWNIRSITRDCLLYATKKHNTPKAKLHAAHEMLNFLQHGLSELDNPSVNWFRHEIEQLHDSHPHYIYHEYLEAYNEPILFTTFIDRIQQHGLQYVADTDLISMFPSTMGPNVAKLFENIEGLIEQEQHSDFLRLRPFRQSVICRSDVTITREIDLDFIDEFYIVANLSCAESQEWNQTTTQSFHTPGGKEYSVSHPITKAALAILSDIYPNGVTTQSLLDRSQRQITMGDGKNALIERENARLELLNLWLSHAIRFSTAPGNYKSDLSKRPLAHTLALVQADQNAATGPLHQDLELDEFSKRLLKLCNGQHTADDLIDELHKRWNTESALNEIIDVGDNSKEAKQRIINNVRPLLERFAKHGLLVNR